MIEQKIPSGELIHVMTFLSEIELFKRLPRSVLEDLAASMTFVSLGGGETLIRQGTIDTTLYVLFQGRLRVYVQSEDLQESTIAEISVGQIVGEIAPLIDQPRTGTVRAIRDSLLLKLDKEAFQKFEKAYPSEMIEIAKTALKRLVRKPRPTQAGENIVTIAVAPAGASEHCHFIPHFIQELNKLKPTLLINQIACNQYFGLNVAQTNLEDPNNILITKWLQSLEGQYGYIIYETDNYMTSWTQRCLRQSDRILLIAEESRSSKLNSIEMEIFSNNSESSPFVELVLIHPEEIVKIIGTSEWLNPRRVYSYHHLRMGYKKDFEKFIRFLTGKAFGVVLNGGGARGFIHAGVLKALDQLNIPIDFIAGCSAGANAAAAYALGLVSQVLEMTNEYINYPEDYTLPLVSLLSGKKNSEFYHRICEETCIEDLWTRFFCVSTNVTQAKLHVHDRGLLWFALRASTSIPAIYPPVYDEEGNMLVDGGILNNMPVDIMRKLMSGGKILAVNCHLHAGEQTKRQIKSTWVSGWKLLLQQFNPFRKHKVEYDNIFKVLMTALTLSSFEHQVRAEKEADYLLQLDTSQYGLLEFKAGKELIDLGYQEALQKLPILLSRK
jgi:predicted acylesterase/phospholipase RssA